MTRILIFLLFAFLMSSTSSWSQSPYIIEDGISDKKYIQLSENSICYIDKTGQLTPEEITKLPDSVFFSSENLHTGIHTPAVLWKKVTFYNSLPTSTGLMLRFCHKADSILLFEEHQSGVIFIDKTGNRMPLHNKPIYSIRNYIPISILSGEKKTFFIANYFSEEEPVWHSKELSFKETKQFNIEYLFKHSRQAFYAGLMLMFSLISFFTFALIRNRKFVYFGLLHLAFLFYFIITSGTFYIFVLDSPSILGISFQDISVSFLILSLCVFMAHYLDLKEKSKKLYRLLMIATVITALTKIPLSLLISSNIVLIITHNILIIILIIILMFPVVKFSLRKNRSAVTLLVAISLLVIAGVIYILALSHILPFNFFTIYSIQLASIIFSLLVFYDLFKIVNEINIEKQHAISLAEIKTKFYTNISHEFRTPLTLIKGPLNELLENNKSEDQSKIKIALKNTDRLMNMINQLTDLAKIEAHQLKIKPEKIEFVRFIRGLTMSFESLGALKGIGLSFSSEVEMVDLWTDQEKMEIIWINLISNAFKFSNKGDQISVRFNVNKTAVTLEIEDTGLGIRKESLPYIFDRFFRANHEHDQAVAGSGIGLSLVKDLVDLLHIEITVKSEWQKGSVFTLILPLGNTHFKADILSDSNIIDASMSFSSEAIVKEMMHHKEVLSESDLPIIKSKATILLVEDNADVRYYVKNQLVKQFNVITATNGQEGIEKAIAHLPELIISDVMMPIVNGLTLCTTLKQDLRTSHIPIILLTAKAGEEQKIEGLEQGADEYLTKPFLPKELIIRVKKMIEYRVQLRKRLLESPTLALKSLDGNPIENKFVTQLGEIINSYLNDPQFGVEKLASEIGLSPSQLNRKLKSITQLSANKYIRHIRLNKALTLLENEDLTVAEVSFKTGFNSVAYFVKCFRESFGETPGTFQKKN